MAVAVGAWWEPAASEIAVISQGVKRAVASAPARKAITAPNKPTKLPAKRYPTPIRPKAAARVKRPLRRLIRP